MNGALSSLSNGGTESALLPRVGPETGPSSPFRWFFQVFDETLDTPRDWRALPPRVGTEDGGTQPAMIYLQASTQRFGGRTSALVDQDLLDLEFAAERHDVDLFGYFSIAIDWSKRPAADFVAAILLALQTGAHAEARRLALVGREVHPYAPKLDHMSRTLAPARVIGVVPARPSARLNHQWLAQNRQPYVGRWVALRDGELLASAASVKELRDQLANVRDVFITRV